MVIRRAWAAAVFSVCVASAAVAADKRQFDVAAGAATQTLNEFGRQANIQLLFDTNAVRDFATQAVSGELDIADALRAMLDGTELVFEFVNQNTIAIMRRAMPAAATSSSTAPAARLHLAQATTATPLLVNEKSGTLTGKVFDATSQKRLAGALVRIDATGETAVADDQGEYRFNNAPAGTYTLSVSFLGYERRTAQATVEPKQKTALDFPLMLPEEIVVFGQRSARALALNRERTAENSSTVISADLLGNFQGTTLSEALRRAPGIAFQQDDNTGDGTNVIVRGMSPDYNQIKLNGIALPDISGTGRATDLSGVLADSISEIVIHKTLLPSHDSAGTGGLIEIETMSPLDRPRRYASVSIEGTERSGDFGDGYLASGTVSGKFGEAENFGLSASMQYRDLSVATQRYYMQGLLGPYLPLAPSGQPVTNIYDIDPRTPFPFEDGVAGYYPSSVTNTVEHVDSTTKTLTLGSEWQISSNANLRLEYLRSDRDESTLSSQNAVGSSLGYRLLPVPALGGELRRVVVDPYSSLSQSHGYYLYASDESLDSYSLRGDFTAGRWSIKPTLGYSSGRSFSPYSYTLFLGARDVAVNVAEDLLPQAIDPVTGVVSSIFGRRSGAGYPVPLLTPAGFARLDANNFFQGGGDSVGSSGGSRLYSSAVETRYSVDGSVLKYIDIGADYKRSHFASRVGSSGNFSANFDETTFRYPTAAAVGLDFYGLPFARVTGSPQSVPLATESSVHRLFSNIDGLVDEGYATYYANGTDYSLNNRSYTEEQDFASYMQARVDLGKLEIVGGARLSRVTVDAAFPNGVAIYDENGMFDQAYYDASAVLLKESATQTDVLPRVAINYRATDNLVFRGGYYSTVARPQVSLLSSTQSISLMLQPTYGPEHNRPELLVGRGNPALKPAQTDNFDLSAEWYDERVGVVKLSVFYKRIENLLESNRLGNLGTLSGIELPDDPRFDPANLPADLYIEIFQPINNPETAKLWGLETALEKQLDFLPGAFGGIGVYFNYTYTDSEKSTPWNWSLRPIYDANGVIVGREQVDFTFQNVRFDQQPKHSGTGGFTYSKHGIDASLLYTYQARRALGVGNYNFGQWEESVDSLDLRAEYRFDVFGYDLRVFLEGANLLKDSRDANTQQAYGGEGSTPRVYTGGFFTGGRVFTFGLSGTF